MQIHVDACNESILLRQQNLLPPKKRNINSLVERGLTGKRLKRRPRSSYSSLGRLGSDEPTLSLEEAAECLIMMPLDKWRKDKHAEKFTTESDEFGSKEDDTEDSLSDIEDDDEALSEDVEEELKKYKCNLCRKCFASPQALGGHRASHTKHKSLAEEERKSKNFASETDESGEDRTTDVKIFQCPYCPKRFESGKALGGHKRIHTFFYS